MSATLEELEGLRSSMAEVLGIPESMLDLPQRTAMEIADARDRLMEELAVERTQAHRDMTQWEVEQYEIDTAKKAMIKKQHIGIHTDLNPDEEIIMEYVSGGHQSSTQYRMIRVKDIGRYLSDTSSKFYRITPIAVEVTLKVND